MHNDIMAVGSRDRPPMFATGRYAQWQSRFMRYIDTRPNCKELKQCIYDGPYVMTKILVPSKPATATEEAVPAHTLIETYTNTTLGKRAYFDAKAKAIHLILTRIEDDIYSTVDACTTTKEMWTTIERLQQGESLNKQDVKTNLLWEFGKFISRDGESIESYYSRFYKMMNEMRMEVRIQLWNKSGEGPNRTMTIMSTEDSDKTKGNNVAGPSVFNMVEHNNSSRMMMLLSGLTLEQLCMCVKIDAGSRPMSR
nr:hypothetical protein [Tanacetum cinerariifolium]